MIASKYLKSFLDWAPRLLGVAILISVFTFIAGSLGQLDWNKVQIPWLNFFAALPLMLVFHALCAMSLYLLNRSASLPLSFAESAFLYFRSLPAVYVPGRIFVVASRKMLLMKRGTSLTSISLVFLLENATSIVGSIAFICLFSIFTQYPFFDQYRVAIITVCLLIIVGFNPATLKALGRVLTVFLPKWAGKINWEYNWQLSLLAMFTYALAWLPMAIGVYLIAQAAIENVYIGFPDIATAIALAGIAGVLAIVTPGGLGVREGVLVAILHSYISIEQASFLAIIIRIWTISGDVLTYFCSLFLANISAIGKENQIDQIH